MPEQKEKINFAAEQTLWMNITCQCGFKLSKLKKRKTCDKNSTFGSLFYMLGRSLFSYLQMHIFLNFLNAM